MCCNFCTNTLYHSIWTPVGRCCTRMWSGLETHTLMNITFYLFNCHPMQIFFWQINQGGRLVRDSLNIVLSTRKVGVGRWRQDFQMLWKQLSSQQPGDDQSFLWDWQEVSCSTFYWRIWSSKAQCFWSRSHCHHRPPYPKSAHFWSPCPSCTPPYNCSCLIPTSGFCFLAQPCS